MDVAYTEMNPISKINGVHHKMLGGGASTEPANGQGELVQSVNYCNHLWQWRAQLVSAIERPGVLNK